MSRVGKKPVTIPGGVQVTLKESILAVKGPKGELKKDLPDGVTKGFERKLEINGVGYKAEVAGDKLNMALGFSHPIAYQLPKGITAKVDKNLLTLGGVDRELLG